MSSKRWKVDMRDIRNMLALVAKDQYSAREVAESIGISHQSVLRHLAKLEDAGISASQALEYVSTVFHKANLMIGRSLRSWKYWMDGNS